MVKQMETDLKEEGVGFTSVVLGTDIEGLKEALVFHCSLPCLQKIIVVWNNLESPAPTRNSDDSLLTDCAVNVTVLPQRDNSINNQFKPYNEIETEGQLCA